jgi:hypothetical protein
MGCSSGAPGLPPEVAKGALRAWAFDRIAEMLNAEGLMPRTGARWWGKTVNNILSAQRSGFGDGGIVQKQII